MPTSIQITEDSQLLHDANCVYCHVDLELGVQVVVCDSCQAPHHADCWQHNNDQCATFGCRNSSAAIQDYLQPTSIRTVQTATVEEDLHRRNQPQRRSYRPNLWLRHKPQHCVQTTVLNRDDAQVNSLSWSKKERERIAVALHEGLVRFWDARIPNTMRPKRGTSLLRSNSGFMQSICWSPNGDLLAMAFRNGTITIWNFDESSQFRMLAFSPRNSTDELSSNVSWSPDGTRMICGSTSGIAHVWDVSTGELQQPIWCHDGRINGVSWSPDGQQLLTGSSDGTAKVWDVNSDWVLIFAGHNSGVNCVTWSPDGERFAFGCDDGTVRIGNPSAEKEVEIFHGHTAAVSCLSWSPNGRYLISGSDDGTVWIQDLGYQPYKPVSYQHGGRVTGLSWSPSSQSFASGSIDKMVQIWDIVDKRR